MNEKNTGAFIASLRKSRKLTQKQLAERLHVSDKAISKWETGRGYPDIDLLMALSSYFGVTVNELLVGKHLGDKEKRKEAQKDIAFELLGEKKRRKRNRWLLIAAAALTLMFLVTYAVGFSNTAKNFAQYFQTDSVCHIFPDYSKIEISGVPYERMYRLVDEKLEVMWEKDKLLCDRPMVGTQLSSVDKIYSVKYCENYDFICLKHDSSVDRNYADAVYCKSDKIDEYRNSSDSGEKRYFIREFVDIDKWNDTALSGAFSQAVDRLTEEDCYNAWSPDGESCDVYVRPENSPLFRLFGYLGEEKGRFFITFAKGDMEHPNDVTYRLDESVSEELGALMPTENRR